MKFLLFAGIIFCIYITFIEPNMLTIKKYSLKDEGLKGLRVVFASDFHFKPHEKQRLKKVVKKINEQNADVILFGGDYVNGHTRENTLSAYKIAEEFAKLKSKYGTFAVIGNHDGWQGKQEIIEEFELAGITILENRNADLGKFALAGVEDLQTAMPDTQKALRGVKKPVILLSHTPDIIEKVPETVNLTLAGHTHGGQVVLPFKGPLIVPSKYGKKYAYGWKPDKKILISKGLGTSIFPVRFNCIPEIVLIEFK